MIPASLRAQLGDPHLVTLSNAAGDTAVISLYGAHVLSWTVAGQELLYCSERATTDGNAAIRAGIPVCFPQFSGFGDLPKHGVVRNTAWQLQGDVTSGSDVPSARARFILSDSPASRTIWPHAFAVTLDVVLGDGTLDVTLGVTNTGSSPFDFTAALHTYLAVEDCRTATVEGLGKYAFIDATTQPFTDRVQDTPALHVTGEVDRIYPAVTNALTLAQPGRKRVIVDKDGFADVVVWNPGPDKVKALADMPDTDWLRMLCIEAVQWQHPVVLQPGGTWQGTQRLRCLT